jgi:hypothetical protein
MALGLKTGGRIKGTRNRRPTYGAVKAMMAGEQSPLDFLLGVMRDEKHDIQLRLMAAKAAAPYMHRALKNVEQSGADGGPQRIIVSWQEPGA